MQSRLGQFGKRHFPKGSLRRYMLSGAFWSVAGSVSAQGFALLASILIARVLGKAGYGKWGLVLSAVMMFSRFAVVGVAQTATKYVAELRKTDPVRAGRAMSLVLIVGLVGALLMGLLCAALASTMAEHLFQIPELSLPFALGGLMLFAMVIGGLLQGALAGFHRFREIAVSSLAQGVILLAAAWLLMLRFGLPGAVLAMTISWGTAALVCTGVLVRSCREHKMPIGLKGVWTERRILWQYATPGALVASAVSAATVFSQAIVARIPGGVAGLGGFNAAYRWRMFVLFIPLAVKRVTLPILSELRGEGDHARFVKALWANIGLNGGVALLSALAIMPLSPWILGMYGQAFRRDWDMMVLLLGSAVFQAVNDVLTQVAVCAEKVWWNFFIHVVWAAQLLGGTWVLVSRYGVRGYVWSLVAATVVHCLLNCCAAGVIVKRLGRAQAQMPVLEPDLGWASAEGPECGSK